MIISNEVEGEKTVPRKQLCLTSSVLQKTKQNKKTLRVTSSPSSRGMMIHVLHSVPKGEMRERSPRGKQGILKPVFWNLWEEAEASH